MSARFGGFGPINCGKKHRCGCGGDCPKPMLDEATNPHWYRVAGLRVALRHQVEIHAHRYRGDRWFVLQDHGSTHHFRFGSEIREFLARLDGELTIETVWRQLRGDGFALSQTEIIQALATLHAQDLIVSEVPSDANNLLARYAKRKRAAWKHYLPSPLLLRVPLLDPDRFLNRIAFVSAIVFSKTALMLWAALLVTALFFSFARWDELVAYGEQRVFTAHNSLLLVLLYPLVKGFHELMHGLALKRWRGEVHEAGLMFMLLMPIPYVDASSSASFPDKYHRMLVGAAGIIAETLLAAVACLLWLNIETGIVRDALFNVMLIGGISTVLFNGNPLLRFDGYYVLSDAIEIPNLGGRANHYYGYLAQKLLGVSDPKSPVTARGEPGWFAGYGVCAYLYRVILLGTIVIWVAEVHLLLGGLMGIFVVYTLLLRPVYRHVRFLVGNDVFRGTRFRAVGIVAVVLIAFGALLAVMPIRSSSHIEGVVWLPNDAEVRAGAGGFVVEVPEQHGRVNAGDTLVVLNDPLLTLRRQTLEWEIRESQLRHDFEAVSDQVGAASLREEISRLKSELAEVQAQADELVVRSPHAGRFLLRDGQDLAGHFVRKGDLLGYVMDISQPTIKAVAKQSEVARIRRYTSAIRVRIADKAFEQYSATLAGGAPAATRRLPSSALGVTGGGRIPVRADEDGGNVALEDVFVLELSLPEHVLVTRTGARAYVRFEHPPEPIATQISRRLRQLFLKRLAV
ncbi:MAG: peptidase M50 [Pseudomonadota bacterium]